MLQKVWDSVCKTWICAACGAVQLEQCTRWLSWLDLCLAQKLHWMWHLLQPVQDQNYTAYERLVKCGSWISWNGCCVACVPDQVPHVAHSSCASHCVQSSYRSSWTAPHAAFILALWDPCHMQHGLQTSWSRCQVRFDGGEREAGERRGPQGPDPAYGSAPLPGREKSPNYQSFLFITQKSP